MRSGQQWTQKWRKHDQNSRYKIITENVKEMCIEANHYLSKDMDIAMKNAVTTEKSELGRKILNQLQDNLKIADEEMIPICQDTGMAVIFWKWGRMFI